LGAYNIGCNGANNRDDGSWLKSPDHPAERNLALGAGLLALWGIQSIHWFPAQVDQIAFEGSKRFQEVRVSELSKRGNECASHGAIKTGVCLVKESS
jgi:hypothetical protein